MLRVVSELLWTIRRGGFPISTAESLDCVRAIELVGFADLATLTEALACVIVTRPVDRPHFDAIIATFFERNARHAADFFGRLRARGFTADETDALASVIRAMTISSSAPTGLGLLGGHSGELDHLLRVASHAGEVSRLGGRGQVGFFVERLSDRVGLTRAGRDLARLRQALGDAIGIERAERLVEAIREELADFKRRVRTFLEDHADERAKDASGVLAPVTFHELEFDEAEALGRAVRLLGQRLRGAERARRRRALRGAIDPGRSFRAMMRSGGVPFRLVRRRRRRDKPKLVILCDVSESVRAASRFLLGFVGEVQELFADARSFVFVSEIAETTELFRVSGASGAYAEILRGRVVSIGANSNYGRVLREFEASYSRELDRRTTLVILGDGRTNHTDPGLSVLRDLERRVGAVLWFCPEAPSGWGSGDSAMQRYAEIATEVHCVRTPRELLDAARAIVKHR